MKNINKILFFVSQLFFYNFQSLNINQILSCYHKAKFFPYRRVLSPLDPPFPSYRDHQLMQLNSNSDMIPLVLPFIGARYCCASVLAV